MAVVDYFCLEEGCNMLCNYLATTIYLHSSGKEMHDVEWGGEEEQ